MKIEEVVEDFFFFFKIILKAIFFIKKVCYTLPRIGDWEVEMVLKSIIV